MGGQHSSVARHTLLLQCVEFGKERRDMDNYAVSDDAGTLWVYKACSAFENERQSRMTSRRRTTGQKMECKRLLDFLWAHRSHNRVPRVVSSGTASADIRLAGQDIDELPLALIAPLGAEHNSHCSPCQSIAQLPSTCTRLPLSCTPLTEERERTACHRACYRNRKEESFSCST
jgi:hypothetical protein